MAYQRVHAYGLLTYTCGVLSTWAYVLWDFVLWAFVRVGFCPDTDLHWLPVRQRIVFKLCSIVSKCLHRTAPSYLTDLCTPVSATTARTTPCTSAFVFTWWPDNTALSTITLRITQFRCLWSCSLELSASSRSRLIFIASSFCRHLRQNCLAGHMEFFHHSMFMIAFAVRMGDGQTWITLLTYLQTFASVSFYCAMHFSAKHDLAIACRPAVRLSVCL